MVLPVTEAQYVEAVEEEFEREEERYARRREKEREETTRESGLEQAEQERMEAERAYAAELRENRLRDYVSARRQVEKIALRVAVKLRKSIEEGNRFGAFVAVLALAILKDGILDILLDMTGIGLIPIVGQAPGWFVSATIYFLAGSGWRKKLGVRMWLMILGFVIDGLPAFEELPITTIVALLWMRDVRREARAAEQHLRELKRKTPEELKELDEAYESEEAEFEESYA